MAKKNDGQADIQEDAASQASQQSMHLSPELPERQSGASQRRGRKEAEDFLRQLIMKIMQWAHTFLSCKMLFYLIVLDGAVQGAVNVVVVFMYKFVLDQLTEKRNAGLATFASCCWIVREANEMGLMIVTIGQALHVPYLGPWTTNGICFSFITWLSLYCSNLSLTSYFASVILWELVALPIFAQFAVMDPQFDFNIKAKPFHRIWILAFVAAVLLRDIDPYTMSKRPSGKRFGDRRLAIPWDPIFY